MWYSCTVALNAWFDDADSVNLTDLGCGLVLERLPDWIKDDESLRLLSWTDREHIRDASWCISTTYAANALGSPDPHWKGKKPRGIQDSINERFSLLSVALWLVKPSCLTCGPVLHFSEKGESKSFRQYASLRPVLITEQENDNQLTLEEFTKSKALFETIMTLKRDSTCWLSIRMLIRALTESMWEARFLWQWIVLESLFGPDSPGETTHRLSQRIALYLGSRPSKRAESFKAAKDAYSWRSKLVHGSKLFKLTVDKSQDLTRFTESTLRASITTILSNNDQIDLFNSKNRDNFLDSLAFGGREI